MNFAHLSMNELLEVYKNRNVMISLDGDRLGIRAPKGVLTDEDKRVLAVNKERLIAHLTAETTDAPFPLTEIQAAYWIGRQSDVLGGVGCHAYREFELGEVDLERLESAWNRLITRHDMLRAVFSDDGQQGILPAGSEYRFKQDVLDVADNPQERLTAIRDAMSHHVFNPGQWPLFDIRVSIIDGRRILHLGMDLLIADAASMLLLYREWRSFYEDPAQNVSKPKRSFAQFVQHGGPSVEDMARAEAYWRPKLAALPGPPQLPFACVPSQIGVPKFIRRSVSINQLEWQALSRSAQNNAMTPSTLLLAAYADVLAAYSKTQHFMLTLTSFRTPPDFGDVVGDFTSTLLVEVDARLTTFRDRALYIQKTLADALEYDGWSGVRVAREIARVTGQADAAIPVVFTSALGHQTHVGGDEPMGWLGKGTYAITQTPQVWIDHHVIEDANGLSLSFDFVDGLFPTRLIDAMMGAYQRLLQTLVADQTAWSGRLGSHLSRIDLDEQSRANETTVALKPAPIHEKIFTHNPASPAIISSSESWSYERLRIQALKIAGEIRDHNIGRGELVGIVLNKGPMQIAAVLGVLMAGAAYLPIPVSAPGDRKNRLADRAGLRLILTDGDPSDHIWPDGVKVQNAECTGVLPARAPLTEAAVGDLAYGIFTSGSTGEPKGVMIEHRAADNTIQDINRRFDVTSNDAVLGLSDLGFDLSVYDIFGLLNVGGRLVLPDWQRVRDPAHWSRLLLEQNVTVWNTVPALAQMLLEHGGGPYPNLRLFLLSGDWVPVDLPQKLREIAPNARVIALGGATEASIWSNYFDTDGLDADATSVPYGWPLANQRFRILNNALEPCPMLVPGWLHIAGDGLARGYKGDSDLTAQKFFNHPVTEERLYATGDLGRYLPGGSIEFLGREDSQVKIGGHRIELGEVEAALNSHGGVQRACALVAGSNPQDHRLVACVVANNGTSKDTSATDDARLLRGAGERIEHRLKRLALRPERDGARRIALAGEPTSGDQTRRSIRQYSQEPVSAAQLAALLSCMGTVQGEDGPLYRYPSAGSAYPVQVWLHVKAGRSDELSGLYAYNPDRHDLELVDPQITFPIEAQVDANRSMVASAAFAIYLVVANEAIVPLYGDLARDFSLIETGAMTQELMLQAARVDLGLCPVGTMDTGLLTSAMELGERHFLAMTIVGGVPQGRLNGTRTTGDLPSQLKQHVSQILPAYMVPEHIVEIDAIPLSSNGKVDRNRLVAEFSGVERGNVERADGAIEESVAQIFAGILGRSDVGRTDAVFDLGGTSLHIVRLHRQLTDTFGAAIDIVDIFRDPTVAGIAARLSASGSQRKAADRKAADLGSTRGAQRRMSKQRGKR